MSEIGIFALDFAVFLFVLKFSFFFDITGTSSCFYHLTLTDNVIIIDIRTICIVLASRHDIERIVFPLQLKPTV